MSVCVYSGNCALYKSVQNPRTTGRTSAAARCSPLQPARDDEAAAAAARAHIRRNGTLRRRVQLRQSRAARERKEGKRKKDNAPSRPECTSGYICVYLRVVVVSFSRTLPLCTPSLSLALYLSWVMQLQGGGRRSTCTSARGTRGPAARHALEPRENSPPWPLRALHVPQMHTHT